MGGTIHATSRLAVGSTFTVVLPLVCEPRSGPPDAPLEHAPVIVTRRSSLADAVTRQCALLGTECRWLNPDQDSHLAAIVASGRETLVIDVDSCAAEADWLIGECADAAYARRCVFLGTAATLADLDLVRRAPCAQAAPKPLSPTALRRLLVTPDPAARAESGQSRVPALGRLRGRVLVVEDNPVNTAVFEGLLEELGCTCVAAATGRAAMALVETRSFDAILMDIHMPDMDGWTTTTQIRHAEGQGRRTPIIALTADAATDTRRRCREAGMDEFLTKPLSLDDLHAVLSRWLPGVAEPAVPAAQILSEKTVSRIRDLDRAGKGGFLKRIATLFVDTSTRQVDAILNAVAGGDLPAVRRQSHSLKSAAAHVGADGLAQMLVEVERAATADDAIRVGLLAEGLRAARDAAVEALQAELHRRTA
jgi:CheY-like chemotaxis protein